MAAKAKRSARTLNHQSIFGLGELYRNGDVSIAEAVKHYLDRIERLDHAGKHPINSVIEVNPQAKGIARQLDREAKEGGWRGPLHGVPILLKDNIDTGDRMQTTAGSIALVGSPASHDAFIVSRLRDAGAVILGKTNLSEWANFRGTRSVSGWSSRGGLTRNPHDRTRTASGSSSGSGAAIAADFAIAAIGTETDGSITCPANACGIVGLKPTLGSLSRTGIIPIAHSQDTAGPMTRSVEDAALVFAAMRGVDASDSATRASRPHLSAPIALQGEGLRGIRIGVARQLAGSQPRVLAIFERSLTTLEELGATLVDDIDFAECAKARSAEFTVLTYEFKTDLNRYLSRRRHRTIRSMTDIVRFNTDHADEVLKYFGQEWCIDALASGSLRSTAYLEARRLCLNATRTVIDREIAKNQLDAVVAPTDGPAHVIDTVNGDGNYHDISTTMPAAVAGYPHITVPCGSIEHLPVGLSFFGRAWSEPALLNMAYAYEQASTALRPPSL